MDSMDEYFDRKEVSRSFQTLFHGRKITGYEYKSIFTMTIENGSPSVVSFVKEMNDLHTIMNWGKACYGGNIL